MIRSHFTYSRFHIVSYAFLHICPNFHIFTLSHSCLFTYVIILFSYLHFHIQIYTCSHFHISHYHIFTLSRVKIIKTLTSVNKLSYFHISTIEHLSYSLIHIFSFSHTLFFTLSPDKIICCSNYHYFTLSHVHIITYVHISKWSYYQFFPLTIAHIITS